MSFSHWPRHLLAFPAKCTSLYETEGLSRRSERFVKFALGTLHFSNFQQSARVCTKQRFQPMVSVFCHFPAGAPLFSDFQQSARVCTNSILSPRSARFFIFALRVQLFSTFQQSARVRTKQKFSVRDQNLLSFSHRVHYVLSHLKQSTRVCTKQTFSAREQNVLSFSHLAHYFKNSLFSPRSPRFSIFILCAPLFSAFEQSARVCTTPLCCIFSKVHDFLRNRSSEPEIRTFCHFRTGHTTF